MNINVCLVGGRGNHQIPEGLHVRLQWHHPVAGVCQVHLECVLLCSRTWRFAATQMHRVPFPSSGGEMGDTMALSRFIHFAMEVGNFESVMQNLDSR